MKVIFFKVENLLNNQDSDAKAPSGAKGVAGYLAKALKKVVSASGARLVLTGDWIAQWDLDDAKCTKDGAYLNRKMEREGMHILSKTGDINAWLQRHPNVTEYCVPDRFENIQWQVNT